MGDEVESLRQEAAALRDRTEELTDALNRLGSGDFAPDGSGTRPVVVPRVQDVPIRQDTGLLHMTVKPFLRRRLGENNNGAQVLVDVVQRDDSGRESSWAHLPPPLLPGLLEADQSHVARVFDALGDDGNRRLLRVLWDGEKPAAELNEQAGLSHHALRRRLTALQQLGWLDVAARDRHVLTARGRRVVVCAWSLASALKTPL